MEPDNNKYIKIFICSFLLLVGFIIIGFYILKSLNLINNPIPKEEYSTPVREIAEETSEYGNIRYFEGYNYATGEIIKDTIPEITITVSNDDYKEIIVLINNLEEIKDDCTNFHDCSYKYFYDQYLIEIADTKLLIGVDYSKNIDKDIYYKTSEELFNKINKIANDYNNKYLYKKIYSSTYSFFCHDNKEKIDITDPKQISKISNLLYYEINDDEKTYRNEKIKYTIYLDDDRSIDLFGVIGRIRYKDGKYKYIYASDFNNYLDELFKNK